MEKEKSHKPDFEFYAQIAIIVALSFLLIYNLGFTDNDSNLGIGTVSASVIPTGTPPVYGKELGIRYDYVSPENPKLANEAIELLGNIDRTETLNGEQKQRYIDILYNINNGISCEYCCGARSVIFENGEPACGCAHSYAMRGLTKYLIKNHGEEFTNEEILTEIGKWKTLFFPGIIKGKAQVMEQQGFDTNYIDLTTNKYRGIEEGKTSGNMIGDC